MASQELLPIFSPAVRVNGTERLVQNRPRLVLSALMNLWPGEIYH